MFKALQTHLLLCPFGFRSISGLIFLIGSGFWGRARFAHNDPVHRWHSSRLRNSPVTRILSFIYPVPRSSFTSAVSVKPSRSYAYTTSAFGTKRTLCRPMSAMSKERTLKKEGPGRVNNETY